MTTFVAEIGVNHNGSLDEALWLIDAAKDAGADVAKFQLWTDKPELSHLALSREQINVCSDYCRSNGIEFLCTPFDVGSLMFLIDDLNVNRIKLSSSAIFAYPLLRTAGAMHLPLILSTGMANEAEIDAAMNTLRYAPDITLMHCVSGYPTPPAQANLRAISRLRTYGVNVGYSDHTAEPLAICTAVALGATMIEMHLTRDCDQDGPDHSSSYEPHEFEAALLDADHVAAMLGTGELVPQECAMELRSKYA